MVYEPGQLAQIVPYLNKVPSWLILGGPADGDEAQTAVKIYPELRVVGIEPVEAYRHWQLENGWPCGAPLLAGALTDSDSPPLVSLYQPASNPRAASLMVERGGVVCQVSSVTIDQLDRLWGPFSDVLLWLDIEGYEVEALRGARELFKRQAVMAVNVEVIQRRAQATNALEAFFAEYNFRLAARWNQRDDQFHDRVYVRG